MSLTKNLNYYILAQFYEKLLSMKNIKIAVAEDQVIYRSGLVSMLNDISGLRVVVEAADGKELIAKMRGEAVDVVLLDYRMPELNGIETARIIRDKNPETRILMLSSYDEEELVMYAFASGAHGYLCKDDDPDEIELAIESVMSTGYYFNDRTSKLLIINMTLEKKVSPKFSHPTGKIEFSQHEIATMRLLANEHSTSDIAKIMGKSERTVDSYRAMILKKTGTKNLAGIIMYGVSAGIIEVKPTKPFLD